MVRFEDIVGALEDVDEGVDVGKEEEEVLEEKLRTRIGKVTFAPKYNVENNVESLHRYLERINNAYSKLEQMKISLDEGKGRYTNRWSKAIRQTIARSLENIDKYDEEIRKIEADIKVYRLTGKRPEAPVEAPKAVKDMTIAQLKDAISKLKKEVKFPAKGGKPALIIMYNRLLEEQRKLEAAEDYEGALQSELKTYRKLYEDELEKYNEITIVKKLTYNEDVVGTANGPERSFNFMIQAGKEAGRDVSDLEVQLENYIREHTINLQPIVVRVVNEDLLGAKGADFDLEEIETYRLQSEEDTIYQGLIQEINDKMLVLKEQKNATLELLSNYVDDMQTRENFIVLAQKLTEAFRNAKFYNAATGELLDEARVGKTYSKTSRSKKFRIVYAGDSLESKQSLSAFMNVVEQTLEISMKVTYLPIISSLNKSSDRKYIFLPIGLYANNKKVTLSNTNHTIQIEDREIPVLRIRNNPDDVKYREYLSEVSDKVSEVVLKKSFFAREIQLQGFIDVKMTGFTKLAEETYLKMKESELLATGALKSPTRAKKPTVIPEALKEYVSEVYIPTMDIAYYKTMKSSGFVDETNPLRYSTRYPGTDVGLPVDRKTALVNQGHVKPQLYIKSKSTQTYLPIKISNDVVQIYNPFSKAWIPIEEYIEQNSILEREANLPVLYIVTRDKMFNFKLDYGITNFLLRTSWTHPSNGIVRMSPVKCGQTVLVSDKTIGDLIDQCKDLTLFFSVKMFLDDFKQTPEIQDHTDKSSRIARSQYVADMVTRLEDSSGVKMRKVKSSEGIYGLATRLLEFSKLFGDIDREVPHENKVRELESYIDTVTGPVTFQMVTELYNFILKLPSVQVLALSGEGFYPVDRIACEYSYHSQLFARIRNSTTLVPINTTEFSTLLAKQVGFEMATSEDKSVADGNIRHPTQQDQFYTNQYQNLVALQPQTGENRIDTFRSLGVDPYIYPLKFYNVVEVTYKSKKRQQPTPVQHQPQADYKTVNGGFTFTG